MQRENDSRDGVWERHAGEAPCFIARKNCYIAIITTLLVTPIDAMACANRLLLLPLAGLCLLLGESLLADLQAA